MCPSVPTHYPDCFLIWGWIVLLLVTALLLVAFGFSVRSRFLTPPASLSASQRLQRQRSFWIVMFGVIIGQGVVILATHQSVNSYVTLLVLAAAVGIAYVMWSRSLRRRKPL